MERRKKVLVAGASGLVGAAAVKRLRSVGCDVVALSRRSPLDTCGATFVSADLLDKEGCRALIAEMSGITHLVYAALFEQPGLVGGWSDAEQIDINRRMFENVLEPVAAGSKDLRHVTLLQGTKAYGVHVRPLEVPAREDRDELRSQPNFYWQQEDNLRAAQEGAPWAWTILRPVLVVGEAIGSSLNAVAAIGVFGALQKDRGLPLAFPGGGPRVGQAVDADVLARAIEWSGETESARNQIFNVANGDVYVWKHVWPALAEVLGMAVGTPSPRSLDDYCRARSDDWDRIRKKHDLLSPGLADFLGASLEYCDYQLRHAQPDPGPPSIVSTVKIQKAGFHDVMDTEDMFKKWLRRLQQNRLLPPPDTFKR